MVVNGRLRPAAGVVIVVVAVRRAELLGVDDFDGPPLARIVRDRLQ